MKRIIRSVFKSLYPSAPPEYHPPTAISAHITNCNTATSASTANVNTNNKNRLVLINGWAGAKRKNLRKVIEYYNGLGYGVVSTVTPLVSFGFVRDFLDDWVFEEVKARTKQQDSLIAHLFSNNGTFAYSSILMKGTLPMPIVTIWESCPYLWYEYPKGSTPIIASKFARVFTSMALRKPVYDHPYITPLISYTLRVFFTIGNVIAYLQGSYHIIPRFLAYNIYLRDQLPIHKVLFIYSTGDMLAEYEKVEEFADILRRRGFDVHMKKFGDDVPHNGAFFLRTEECKEFLQKHL